MKKDFLFVPVLLAFVIALSAPCLATNGNGPSDDIKNAAKEGIKFHLKDARFDQGGRNMGFESQDDIDNADLGEGFQIYTIDTNKLLDESAPQDLQSLVTTRNQWEFLVQTGGKAKSLLTVYSAGKKWKTGAVRPSELVKEMSGFLAAWPASSGYQYRFIRVFPISDFIELSQDGKVLGLFSLNSLTRKPGRTSGKFTAQDLLDPQEVLSNLRVSIKQNIESNKTGGVASDDIKKAGREGIKELLKDRKHDKSFQNLGFDSQYNIDKAELGEGIQIFTLNTRKLLDESAPLDLQSLVIPTGEWDLLIRADGQANSLLKVGFFDGKWKHVGIGASPLAKELDSFLAAWPASEGNTYRYIRMPQVSSDFIELSSKGKVLGIFPLSTLTRKPGRAVGEFKQSDLLDPQEVLTELRTEIKQSIEAYKNNNR